MKFPRPMNNPFLFFAFGMTGSATVIAMLTGFWNARWGLASALGGYLVAALYGFARRKSSSSKDASGKDSEGP